MHWRFFHREFWSHIVHTCSAWLLFVSYRRNLRILSNLSLSSIGLWVCRGCSGRVILFQTKNQNRTLTSRWSYLDYFGCQGYLCGSWCLTKHTWPWCWYGWLEIRIFCWLIALDSCFCWRKWVIWGTSGLLSWVFVYPPSSTIASWRLPPRSPHDPEWV